MRKSYWYLPLLLIALFVSSCGGSGGGGVVILPTGAATLAWAAPTTNDDSSPLNDLAGFKIHYGTSTGQYTNTIIVSSATATTYTVTHLHAGATYFFVVTAYNASGVESAPSNEANKKI